VTWQDFTNDCEILISRVRWICAAAVPAFIAVNHIWGFFSDATATRILETFLALGFISGQGTVYLQKLRADRVETAAQIDKLMSLKGEPDGK